MPINGDFLVSIFHPILPSQLSKKKMKKKGHSITKISRGTAMLLMVLHLFIGISYTFYIHTHSLDNGGRLVHSHPISGNDSRSDAQHHHENSILQLIPDLNRSISENPWFFNFEQQNPACFQYYYFTSKPLSQNGSIQLRGPPVMI